MTPTATLERIHAELQELTRHQVKHARKPTPSPVYLDHPCDAKLGFASDSHGQHGTQCPCQAVVIIDGRHYCWTHNKMRLRDAAKGAA